VVGEMGVVKYHLNEKLELLEAMTLVDDKEVRCIVCINDVLIFGMYITFYFFLIF
jgi:hypothetical protein